MFPAFFWHRSFTAKAINLFIFMHAHFMTWADSTALVFPNLLRLMFLYFCNPTHWRLQKLRHFKTCIPCWVQVSCFASSSYRNLKALLCAQHCVNYLEIDISSRQQALHKYTVLFRIFRQLGAFIDAAYFIYGKSNELLLPNFDEIRLFCPEHSGPLLRYNGISSSILIHSIISSDVST